MSGTPTYTSLDAPTGTPPAAPLIPSQPRQLITERPAPRVGNRAAVSVRESYGVSLGTIIGGPGWGLFAGDDSLTDRYGGFWPADRLQLPNHAPTGIFAEPQWRAILSWSRYLCERNQLAIGFREHLVNFIGPVQVQWVLRDGDVSPDDAEEDPLVRATQRVWDEWCEASQWGPADAGRAPSGEDGPDREKECRGRLIRDGEVLLRLGPGKQDRDFLPWVRQVEPEQVRQPTGYPEIEGVDPDDVDWQWGVATSRKDAEREYGRWVAYPDSGGADGEFVPAGELVAAKANVDRMIKRGLPDFFPVEGHLQVILGLLGNMGQTGKAQAAIAWIEKYATATPEQVREMLRQGADAYTLPPGNSTFRDGYPARAGGGSLPVKVHPGGTTIHTDNNREMSAGPVTDGVPSFVQVVDATLKAVGWRWGFPDWFTGGADSFASALVTGSPFARSIESRQDDTRAFTARLAMRVILLAERSGRLPAGTHRKVKPVVTAKPVILADEQKQASVWDTEVKAGVMDPQEWIKKRGRKPKVVLANIKAWKQATGGQQPGQGDGGAGGDQQPPGKDPKPTPPGSAGGDGLDPENEDLSSVFEGDGPHEYGCALVPLVGAAAVRLLELGRSIPDADLAADGREKDPHVTIRYGIHSVGPAEVVPVLAASGPVTLWLGKVTVFAGEEHDVLKADVESPDLRRLHAALGKLPHTDTHPTYVPHATIAYVRPGLGKKYADRMPPLDLEVSAPKAVYGGPDGSRTVVPFGPTRASEDDAIPPGLVYAALVESLAAEDHAAAETILGWLGLAEHPGRASEDRDRSHLVKRVKTNKAGHKQTVWVNPDKDRSGGGPKPSKLAEREKGRGSVRETFLKAKSDPSSLSHDEVQHLAENLHRLTRDELRNHARDLKLKLGGVKAEIVARLVSHARAGKKLPAGLKELPPAGLPAEGATPAAAAELGRVQAAVRQAGGDVLAVRPHGDGGLEIDIRAGADSPTQTLRIDPEGKRSAAPPMEQPKPEPKPEPKADGPHPLHEKLKESIASAPKLTTEQKTRYHAAVERVVSVMPQKARDLAHAGLKKVGFHPTTLDVGNALADEAVATGKTDAERAALETRVAGFRHSEGAGAGYVPAAGALHMDGDYRNRAMGAGSGGHGTASEVQVEHEIYAHELGHAIDGPHRAISHSAEWVDAQEAEIEPRGDGRYPLTKYATTNYQEGLAEFARLLYGSDVPPEQVEREFPKCAAVFKSHGLWPDRR